MKSEAERSDDSGAADRGGPVVVACLGPRCAGLHALATADPDDGPLALLRTAVRTSHAGLLITTGCMGPCHEGAVVGVGHRTSNTTGRRLVVRGMMLLGGMQQAVRAQALATWFAQGGPTSVPMPAPVLTEASLGAPPPLRNR